RPLPDRGARARGRRGVPRAARDRVRLDRRGDGPARGLPLLGAQRVVPRRDRAARALRRRLVRRRRGRGAGGRGPAPAAPGAARPDRPPRRAAPRPRPGRGALALTRGWRRPARLREDWRGPPGPRRRAMLRIVQWNTGIVGTAAVRGIAE